MTPTPDDFAEAQIDELWRRILVGEDAAEVLADLDRRHAVRRAAFDAERARLQAEIDACTVRMLALEGRLH
ncbi:MAG: hypothetical protein IPK42_02110 [Betaproteobacteria bacterium]|jgi:lipase chaperone LimK|nr:hypothetical protein [Betaproteobacteria bacterium]